MKQVVGKSSPVQGRSVIQKGVSFGSRIGRIKKSLTIYIFTLII